MKGKLFTYCLKILRKIAIYIQIGNPNGKAPKLVYEQIDRGKGINIVNVKNDIFIWKLYNAICSGLYGGAVIDNKNTIYNKFVSFAWGNDLHPTFSLPYIGRKVAMLENAIFLITPEAKGNYYHWIVDLLPRLLLIKKLQLNDFAERMIILHTPPKRYENDVLSLIGVEQRKIIRINAFETVKVKELIVADYVNCGELFPVWKKELLTEFKNSVIRSSSTNFTKIYLLRGKQKIRQLIGEERLISILKRCGFEIVDMQVLNVTEQIKIISSAQIVVGLHGAALTNTIFCKDGTRVIEIRSSVKPPEFFSEIAKTCNLIFESINVPPVGRHEKGSTANKQNLVLTEESINLLMSKLQLMESVST